MGKPKSNNSHSKAPPRNKPASNKAPKYVAPASSSESEPESDEDENFMSFNKKGQSDSEDDAIYKDSDESEDDEDVRISSFLFYLFYCMQKYENERKTLAINWFQFMFAKIELFNSHYVDSY